MDLTPIKDWLVPVATFGTLIVGSIAGWNALREFRLKATAETRLADSERTASDIKLLELFSNIMDVAHGRSGHVLSETAVGKLLSSPGAEGHIESLLPKAVAILGVGAAAQQAAIRAVQELGMRHEFLRPIAEQGLKSLSETDFPDSLRNLAKQCLNDLLQSPRTSST